MTWEQAIVDAQVEVNRAVYEMNKPGELPPRQREPELRYVVRCLERAIGSLRIARAGLSRVKPFTDRELKKWERAL